MRKTVLFALIYLFPWGIQCLAANFIPMYLANLSFVSEKTAGTAIAFGGIVTMLAQGIWGRIADKSKNRKNVLCVSLAMLAVCSGLFLRNVGSLRQVYLLIFLFYSCYMVHQPLIDSIAVENTDKSSFARLRSFASLGYALTGFVYGILPQNNVNNSFVIMIILAAISTIIAAMLPKNNPVVTVSEKSKAEHLWEPGFTLFIVATFLIFLCSSALTAFSPIFYTNVLKGGIGFYSLVLSIGTLIEWGFMVVFGKKLMSIRPKTTFRIMLAAGILQAVSMFAAQSEVLVGLSMLFKGLWFGILWSFATPYLKRVAASGNITMAQSVWTIASSGIATSLGAFSGGYIAEFMGLRNLFLVVALLLAAVFAATHWLISENEL